MHLLAVGLLSTNEVPQSFVHNDYLQMLTTCNVNNTTLTESHTFNMGIFYIMTTLFNSTCTCILQWRNVTSAPSPREKIETPPSQKIHCQRTDRLCPKLLNHCLTAVFSLGV